ncbi:early nodulin-like protein 1 [Quercus suber]|uniref:Early nodulin-like protein 1 n=1 Tax=Quercus suber TaxID=58331 RepID=A0AAW0IHK0_QUESU
MVILRSFSFLVFEVKQETRQFAFGYQNDSVLVVDKWDYYHCNTTEPITSFSNGKSVIQLDRSGPFYFISGDTDHCKHGQRLLVEVMSMHMHHIPPSPPSIAFPPGSDTRTAPASSAISTAPAPSPSSGIQVSAKLGSVYMALIAAISVGALKIGIKRMTFDPFNIHISIGLVEDVKGCESSMVLETNIHRGFVDQILLQNFSTLICHVDMTSPQAVVTSQLSIITGFIFISHLMVTSRDCNMEDGVTILIWAVEDIGITVNMHQCCHSSLLSAKKLPAAVLRNG